MCYFRLRCQEVGGGAVVCQTVLKLNRWFSPPSWWSVKRRRPLKSTKDWTVQNSWKAQMFQTAIVSWINGNGWHSETISIRLLFIIAINSWGRLRFVFIRSFSRIFIPNPRPKATRAVVSQEFLLMKSNESYRGFWVNNDLMTWWNSVQTQLLWTWNLALTMAGTFCRYTSHCGKNIKKKKRKIQQLFEKLQAKTNPFWFSIPRHNKEAIYVISTGES